jgi:plasmid stability protein
VTDVPALHIRDVPEHVLETLKAAARENGRSLNAEILAWLAERANRHVNRGEMTRRLAEIAARVNLPPDAPTPEELIRADRDSR